MEVIVLLIFILLAPMQAFNANFCSLKKELYNGPITPAIYPTIAITWMIAISCIRCCTILAALQCLEYNLENLQKRVHNPLLNLMVIAIIEPIAGVNVIA